VARALGAAPGVAYVHEPDNWKVDALAHLGQREVGRFPVLAPDARAPDYGLVWRLAMRGGWPADGRLARARERAYEVRRPFKVPAMRATAAIAARRPAEAPVVAAKTVLGLGALEWLADRHADCVAIVTADPANVVSSWRSLGWGPGHIDEAWFADHRPDLLERAGGWPDDEVGQVAVAIGALDVLMGEAMARNPGWVVISHEALCHEPIAGFRNAFEQLGLDFGDDVEHFLTESDTPGEGLATRRVTAEQPERWRRLPADELARVREILQRF
jgi:hypothetical protein